MNMHRTSIVIVLMIVFVSTATALYGTEPISLNQTDHPREMNWRSISLWRYWSA
ncbi:hypothetical protein BH24ACI3_BH24ACI3_17410 [soil metagenome]